MHTFGNAPRRKPRAVLAREDEVMAGHSNANLLITSAASGHVETLARRIHRAGARARFPFVCAPAVDLSTDLGELRHTCCDLLDAAAGGTLLLSEVEDMPPPVQELLVEVLHEMAAARGPSADVRLVAGTSVSLLDRVADGTFSARLFYRLNMIHLRSGRHGSAIGAARSGVENE